MTGDVTTDAGTSGAAMSSVITECDHDSFEAEHLITDPIGAELVLTQSFTAADVVANAAGAS